MKQLMWEDKQGEMTAQCFFDPKTSLYTVEVSLKNKTKKKRFPCSFTPTFGMDVIDQRQSLDIAEELAVEHEKEMI